MVHVAIKNIKTLMIAEYKELTAPFGRLRGFIPLMSAGFIIATFTGLFLLIEAVFSIADIHTAIELNEKSLTLIAFVLTLETFLSFFLPISVPLSRFTMEGRDFDLLLSLPLKHWHLLIGVFLAEAILSLPLFVFTGTGSIFLLTYLFFQDVAFAVQVSMLSFILILLLSTVSLWLGLLITRFLSQLNPAKAMKPFFNIILSAVAIILILLVNEVSRQGKNALEHGWLSHLPPTQASLIIMNMLTTKKIDLMATLPILTVFLLELSFIVFVTAVIAIKIHFRPGDSATHQLLKTKKISLTVPRLAIPDRFKVDWILFKRFLRDVENMSRLVLSVALALTVLSLFQNFVVVNIPENQVTADLISLLVEAVTIFGLLGMISIVAFLETSFFAMEARENIFLFLTIPRSLRTVMIKKMIQVELQVVFVSVIITVIGWAWHLLPNDPLTTWITVSLLGLPMPMLLLGIYQLNPPSDEQDVTHLFNAFMFFLFLIACQFLIIFLVFWLQASRFVTVGVLFILLLALGVLSFIIGLNNIENYDLGLNAGPHTKLFRSFIKVTGIFSVTHFSAILTAIVALRLFNSLLSFVIGFYGPYLFISLVLRILGQREDASRQLVEEVRSTIGWKHTTAQLLGIIFLGILINQIFPSGLLNASSTIGVLEQFIGTARVEATTTFIYNMTVSIAVVSVILLLIVVIEETFFRKTLIDQLQKEDFPKPLVLLISSFFFMIAHAAVILGSVITTFLLGIILAREYYQKRSLTSCILIHLYYNMLVLIITIMLVFFA